MAELHIRGNKWLLRLFGLLLIFGPIYAAAWYTEVVPVLNKCLLVSVAVCSIIAVVFIGAGIFGATFSND